MVETLPTAAPPAPAKKGIFGGKEPPAPDMAGPFSQINALSARLRMGEERYGELRKKMLVVEQNMLRNHKLVITEVKALQNELNDVKRSIQVVEDKIATIIKEIRLMARREDVDVLRKYIEAWNPVKFVSHEQVEKMIDEALKTEKPVRRTKS